MPDKIDKIAIALEVLNAVLARVGNVSVREAIDWAQVEENARRLEEETASEEK